MTHESSKDYDDYWNETKITTDDFDEDNVDPCNGSLQAPSRSTPTSLPPVKVDLIPPQTRGDNFNSDFGAASILDHITTDSGKESPPSSTKLSSSSSSHSIGRSLGSIGKNIQEWKPSGVKIFATDKGLSSCSNCIRLEKQIQQFDLQNKSRSSHENVALPIDLTISRMIMGQTVSLQSYTSLQDKKDLLQSALLYADSDTILTVILFCRNTLSKTLFMSELQQNKELAKIYIAHLKKKKQTSEAVEILTALGKFEESALLKYKQCLNISDHSKKTKALRQLSTEMKDLPHSHYSTMINQYANLLDQQREIDTKDSASATLPIFKEYPRASKIYDRPLLTTLFYCCMYHWGDSDDNSPARLRLKYAVGDKEFLWTVIRGRARVKHYHLPDQLVALVNTKSGVIGALSSAFTTMGGPQATLKNYLAADRVVDTLHNTAAPDTIMTAYLSHVEPKDQRLRLALQYDIKQAVVEAYIATKDKANLHRYISTNLTAGSADYIKAENALKRMQ